MTESTGGSSSPGQLSLSLQSVGISTGLGRLGCLTPMSGSWFCVSWGNVSDLTTCLTIQQAHVGSVHRVVASEFLKMVKEGKL